MILLCSVMSPLTLLKLFIKIAVLSSTELIAAWTLPEISASLFFIAIVCAKRLSGYFVVAFTHRLPRATC